MRINKFLVKSLLLVLSFILVSCNNLENKLLFGHSWTVDTILHKEDIVFSYPDNNSIVVSNIIVFGNDDFIRMPWVMNTTPNNGYWEIKRFPKQPDPVIEITQLPYDDFNGIYSVDIIKKGNGLIFLILKSDDYTFKCRTAI